jgi:sodium-coupled neutral amino acid transporter 11
VSFFLFLLVGILTDFSIVILISTGEKLGVQTYQDLVYISLGRFGYFLLVFIQFLYPFICKFNSFFNFIRILNIFNKFNRLKL